MSRSWVFQVIDVDDQPASISFGIEGGYVTCRGPKWWKADPETSTRIRAAQEEAESLVRRQQES